MAFVSRLWPFIHPGVLGTLELSWWAYYVRAAQQIHDEQKRQRDELTNWRSRRGR